MVRAVVTGVLSLVYKDRIKYWDKGDGVLCED